MTEQTAPLQITKDLLKPWSPCTDGYKWFLDKFPQGGAYLAVQAALRADKRFDDARWLTDKVWENVIFTSPAISRDVAADHKTEAIEIIEATKSLKVDAPDSKECSGDAARIGSSGDAARIGSSGYDARIGSSGDAARIGSSGDDARINASGANAIVACAGMRAISSAGENGAIALPWWDEASNRTRFAVGYVGENIKPGVFYTLDGAGEFTEVAP